jgi:hypothetical protein
MLARVQHKLGEFDSTSFNELESPDFLVSLQSIFVDGEAQGIFKASTVVDASAEDCAAWELSKMSRAKLKAFYSSNGLERSIIHINEHLSVFQVVTDLRVPGLLPREYVSSIMWKWQDEDTLVIALESVDVESVPMKDAYLRASATNLFEYKKLPHLGEGIGAVPQTRVTLIAQVSAGGNIPRRFADRMGAGPLKSASRLRKAFDRSVEIEVASLARLGGMIWVHEGEYTDEEIVSIDAGKDRMIMFERMKTKDLTMKSPSTKATVAFEDNDSHAWGWAETTVRAE